MKIKMLMFLLVIFFLVSCTLENGGDQEEYYVAVKEIDINRINHSLNMAGKWLLNNQNPNGSLNYRYFPDSEEYLVGNNMIRQFMSTIALYKMYEYTDDENYLNAYKKNLEYNFKNYYRWNDDVGYISYNNIIKLGAGAFAYWSLMYTSENEYLSEKENLRKFIFLMQNLTTGKFTSFYNAPLIGANQNFYPGEAMLTLMNYYEITDDKEYLETVKRSFDYYVNFFRNDSNPAFVPCHTMADYKLYQATKDKEYADFIFEMNDFLIEIQNRNCEPDKRFLGRFYDPKKDYYGPPHASSTAVYVEGLTYAYKLAKELGDEKRAEEYKEAIILGVRSLMQLQFDSGDLRVIGGIKKTADDNEIRIDNNQHTIMAFLQVLDVFYENDFPNNRYCW